MPLSIETKHLHPDIVILELTGKITMGNDCQQVEWTAKKLVNENRKKVIFDITNVTHLDSTGIGIIVTVAGQMKHAGGELRVAGANEHVDQILRMTNVHQIVGLHRDTSAAASNF
ncbi:MAG TPA: STAS domain-containing protein [Candidatus Sulfotelmatobacter sp.]|nr:STAS domain-containing protein [Candidatus Sulfotelmatobacter sp.]